MGGDGKPDLTPESKMGSSQPRAPGRQDGHLQLGLGRPSQGAWPRSPPTQPDTRRQADDQGWPVSAPELQMIRARLTDAGKWQRRP